MTNLDIIKYLATNNPTRLAELLDDIYCRGWNCGAYAARCTKTGKFSPNEIEFAENGWIHQEASTDFFLDCELNGWSKAINSPPTITAFYDGLSVTIPIKDSADHMWNNNNEYDYKENRYVKRL